MGHRHSKSEMLEGAIDAVLADGISRLTFGSLARRLGTSDRVVVYYFPSKDDLVAEVLVSIGLRLQAQLGPALRRAAVDHLDFARSVWPTLARADSDPIFAVFFEASGLAAAGVEPYRSLVPVLVDGWVDWAAQSIAGSAARRRAQATAAVAMLDGLLLMRQLAGPDAANRAARAILHPRS